MKKHESLSAGEELLAQVLDECLEEDLSFVPPEREIARKHRFSEAFEQKMQKLLDQMSGEKEIRRHFLPRYGQWAACLLLFCICGSLFYYVLLPSMGPYGGVKEESGEAAPAEEMSDGEWEASDAPAEEAIPEEAEEETAVTAGEDAGQGAEGKLYCGRTVYPAEQQEVPDTFENVTVRINCPVLDEENPVLFLTIGNTGEEEVRYYDQSNLEVWLEDAWYQIPMGTEEQGQWLTLEAGMAVDEEINLSVYEIDHTIGRYRLVTRVEDGAAGAEFTFEEAFTKDHEELKTEKGWNGT